VVVYLEDEDSTTRKDAAICCCRLVANSLSSQYTGRSGRIGSRKKRRLVEEVSFYFQVNAFCCI
jgi:serine/threonine-protein kinase mTOR